LFCDLLALLFKEITTMDAELQERFMLPSNDASSAILAELQSVLRIHDINAEDVWLKWESYAIKMGSEDTKLDLKTVRDFKKDLQENLEREVRGKQHNKGLEKRTVAATPRAGINNGDMFDMYGVYALSIPHSLINLQACSEYSSQWHGSWICFKTTRSL
jgi:DNA polymerase alpha subunit B